MEAELAVWTKCSRERKAGISYPIWETHEEPHYRDVTKRD